VTCKVPLGATLGYLFFFSILSHILPHCCVASHVAISLRLASPRCTSTRPTYHLLPLSRPGVTGATILSNLTVGTLDVYKPSHLPSVISSHLPRRRSITAILFHFAFRLRCPLVSTHTHTLSLSIFIVTFWSIRFYSNPQHNDSCPGQLRIRLGVGVIQR